MTSFAFVREFTPGAAGIWLLLAVVSVALIKAWPILALQAIEARDRLRKERRDDLDDCKARLDAMTLRLDTLQESFTNLKIELSAALSAYRIVEVELDSFRPSSLGLAEARAILSTAFTVAPSTTGPKQ